ncbi:MAG: hypothetical protein HY674_00445 [Chloroflexi bacterium]|nr:hypothetical protein [Chloroflexota bacterium]
MKHPVTLDHIGGCNRSALTTPATLLLAALAALSSGNATATEELNKETLDAWSAPYRGWHYWPDHVVPAAPAIAGATNILGTDVPTVYQIPGDPKFYMSFVTFDGRGYQSYVGESNDLVHWTAHPEPLYKAGGNPSGLDQQYAHKISLVFNPQNETFYLFYNAVPGKPGPTGGRGIGLITSKPRGESR